MCTHIKYITYIQKRELTFQQTYYIYLYFSGPNLRHCTTSKYNSESNLLFFVHQNHQKLDQITQLTTIQPSAYPMNKYPKYGWFQIPVGRCWLLIHCSGNLPVYMFWVRPVQFSVARNTPQRIIVLPKTSALRGTLLFGLTI